MPVGPEAQSMHATAKAMALCTCTRWHRPQLHVMATSTGPHRAAPSVPTRGWRACRLVLLSPLGGGEVSMARLYRRWRSMLGLCGETATTSISGLTVRPDVRK